MPPDRLGAFYGSQFSFAAHRFLRDAGRRKPNRRHDRGSLSPSWSRLAIYQLRGRARGIGGCRARRPRHGLDGLQLLASSQGGGDRAFGRARSIRPYYWRGQHRRAPRWSVDRRKYRRKRFCRRTARNHRPGGQACRAARSRRRGQGRRRGDGTGRSSRNHSRQSQRPSRRGGRRRHRRTDAGTRALSALGRPLPRTGGHGHPHQRHVDRPVSGCRRRAGHRVRQPALRHCGGRRHSEPAADAVPQTGAGTGMPHRRWPRNAGQPRRHRHSLLDRDRCRRRCYAQGSGRSWIMSGHAEYGSSRCSPVQIYASNWVADATTWDRDILQVHQFEVSWAVVTQLSNFDMPARLLAFPIQQLNVRERASSVAVYAT
ncbi:hypothetical protein RHSP_53726 [Rhizobium freirei PRF 81]|uniref:Uncharacterized protein n=1 Tax=Rhizobium freirei PRF 81 TaxID=363754 RepID=N6TY28_9HYPH|nr:hypothetical protein RHSP_53726 [Rhizobium freirei PRF 81]